MSRPQAIGIDLGTTFSAVARLNASGRTEMILNADGEILTPSVVLFEDQQTIVGKAARKLGMLAPERLAECVKRDMGNATYSRPIRGEFLPPETIQACILRRLKEDIARAVGPASAVVIAVPAYFDESRRKATADAGEIAGLDLLDIVNEPTAAALAFGEDLGYLTAAGEPRESLTVLVYDLGGGTFDVTVIRVAPGDLRTLATDGDVMLGGRDWDIRLADVAAASMIREHGVDPRRDPAVWQRFIGEVEAAKRTLTARQEAVVSLERAEQTLTVKVTREEFESATADLLERTASTTRQVVKGAGVEWSEISRILLVGGSSRMPMVPRMLEPLSGKTPERTVNADEAVARGAALYARYLLSKRGVDERPAGFEVVDVNAHSLGIEGVDPRTGVRRNAILIRRNTPLPVRKTREFVTRVANQPSIALRVLEGESTSPDDCTPIGRTVIDNLPTPLPQGWPIKVTYQYGTNGRLSVRGAVPGTENEVTLEIERERGMDDRRLSHWKRAIEQDAGFDSFHEAIASEFETRQRASAADAPRTSRRRAAAASTSAFEGGTDQLLALDDDVPAATATVEPDLPGSDSSLFGGQAASSGAVEYAHAVAASENRRAAVTHPGRSTFLQLAGHLLFSLAGLALGYYILCWLKPEANFLELPLPGLRP